MDEKAATFMDLLEASQFSIGLSLRTRQAMNDKQAGEPEMTACA